MKNHVAINRERQQMTQSELAQRVVKWLKIQKPQG